MKLALDSRNPQIHLAHAIMLIGAIGRGAGLHFKLSSKIVGDAEIAIIIVEWVRISYHPQIY